MWLLVFLCNKIQNNGYKISLLSQDQDRFKINIVNNSNGRCGI